LGIGDWGLGPIPNPQSPIPNPQSPVEIIQSKINNIYLKYFLYLKLNYIFKNDRSFHKRQKGKK
jgi:hypothetical protein